MGTVDHNRAQVRIAFVSHDLVTLANGVRGVTLYGQREVGTIGHVDIERTMTLSAGLGPSIIMARAVAAVMTIEVGVVHA